MRVVHFFLVSLALIQPCFASSPELVFDLNSARTRIGSNPSNLEMIGSTVYFFADDGIHGEEVWRSDGTASGTRMVADLTPGPRSSKTYSDVIKIDNAIYFYTNDSNIVKFYKIEEGKGIQKIATFNNAARIVEVKIAGGRLFFVLSDQQYGYELWTMDGNTPRIVKDIRPGPSGQVMNLTEFNGILYFTALDSTHGYELWRSDGTEAGTFMVRDIRPGEQDSFPSSLTPFAGRLVFAANDGIHGKELWKTDGTELGTSMIRDLNPGSAGVGDNTYGPLPVLRNKLYFDGTFDKLYQMDAGLNISLVRDIDPDKEDTCCISFLRAGANYIFFAAADSKNGTALWRSDGTPNGTIIIADPYKNKDPYLYIHDVVGDHVVFITWGRPGLVLWLSDGTKNGTRVISRAENIFNAVGNGQKWFASIGDDTNGTELFVFNSTDSSARLVKKLRIGNASSAPHNLIVQKQSLFFSATDENGPGIWETNGKNLRLIDRVDAQRIARTSDAVYFVDDHQKLFRIDSIGNVKEVNVGNFDNYGPMRGVGSKLFFSDYSNVVATDGTASGTRSIVGPRSVNHLTLLGNTLYTVDSDKTIWQIDTVTLQARKLFTPNSDQNVLNLSVGNGSLYFIVKTQGKTEFWRSNGTPDTNVKLAETNLSANNFLLSYPHWFFNGTDDQYGSELRTLDLNTNQIFLVKDMVAGSSSTSLRPYAGFDGSIVFLFGGQQTWFSNGSDSGTFMISPEPSECFTVAGSHLYFSMSLQNTGNEPFVLDSDGASQIADIYRGPYSSQPCEFTFFNGSVYFAAADAQHGRELWRISATP